MRVAKYSDKRIIKELTFNDGFGYLAPIVFFQGCDIRCEGCHNEQLWNIRDGEEVSVDDVIEEITKYLDKYEAIVYQGGEPTLQSTALKDLMKFANYFGMKNILYTGRDISELDDEILEMADIIKFGEYGRRQYIWNKEDQSINLFREASNCNVPLNYSEKGEDNEIS